MSEVNAAPKIEIQNAVSEICHANPGVPIGEEILGKGPISEVADTIGVNPRPWFESLSRDKAMFVQAYSLSTLPDVYLVVHYRTLQKSGEREIPIEKGILFGMYFICPEMRDLGLYMYETFVPETGT